MQRKGYRAAPVHEGHAAAEQPAHKNGCQVLPIADGNLELMALQDGYQSKLLVCHASELCGGGEAHSFDVVQSLHNSAEDAATGSKPLRST